MCSKKHLEFIERLEKESFKYRNEEYKLISEFKRYTSSVLVQNKYGTLKVMPCKLLSDNDFILNQVVNKKEYLLNELADKNKKILEEIINIRDASTYNAVLIESIYGEVKVTRDSLFVISSFSVLGATDRTDFWINKCKHKRGDEDITDYSKVVYKNNKTKVKLRCKKHDYNYEQRPSRHLSGTEGCAYCMKQTIRYSKDNFITHKDFFKEHNSYFYVLRMQSKKELFYKVGITGIDRLKYRLNALKLNYDIDIIHLEEGNTEEKYYLEQRFLEEFKDYKYEPRIKFGGHTECISINPVDTYYEWFNNLKNNYYEQNISENRY